MRGAIGATAYAVAFAVAAIALLGASGCAAGGRLPASEAFARSASALSGTESYGFAGQLSVYNPAGRLGSRMSYEGVVNGHGEIKLQWHPPRAASEEGRGPRTSAYRPLQLLETLNSRNAEIVYADDDRRAGPIRLLIRLDDAAAKERIAGGLRAEMALLREDARSDEAGRLLAAAEERLEAALSTLKVDTEMLWEANPHNWFPTRMSENTLLKYEWDGRVYEEKRTSETNFLSSAQVVQ
ncbi:hypothetical protein ACF3MZ_12350 [Paenibacillaceae bacterium WGS1546]|uniref:hypothetical protein n=1 Tax=Cohnella sp. WGS1546 TaxID=3366810 RepID=UPI00372D4B2E